MLIHRRLLATRMLDAITAAGARMKGLGLRQHSVTLTPAPLVQLTVQLEDLTVRTRVSATLDQGCNLISWCWDDLKLTLFKCGYLPGPLMIAAVPRLALVEPGFQAQPVFSLAASGTRRCTAREQPGLADRSSGARAALANGQLDFSWCASGNEQSQ